MPVSIALTAIEADALAQTKVDGELNERVFTYDPKRTLAICAKLEKVEHEGAARLVTRLADLMGHFVSQAPVKRRSRASKVE